VAIAKETVTTEQVARILNFYERDLFILRGQENVNRLTSIIPDLTQIAYNAIENLYSIKVNSWPQLKSMCLKFAPKKPCEWIYITETDDLCILFHYSVDTYTIYFP
jgi:hypothetical protein